MIITNYHPILMIITNYHLIRIIITIYSIMKDVGDVVLGVLAIVCFIVGTVSNSAILSFFISKKHDKYEDFPVVISLHLLFFFSFFLHLLGFLCFPGYMILFLVLEDVYFDS